MTFGVNRFFANDDGTGFSEAGRVQLFNSAGEMVAEETFVASNSGGNQTITVTATEGFTTAVFTAGIADDTEFVFGGYANGDGSFGSDPFAEGSAERGSDYVLDFLEFTFDGTSEGGQESIEMQPGSQEVLQGPGLEVLGRSSETNEPDLG